MNHCTCTLQSSLYAPLTCTTRQNKNLVNLQCWSTALTHRGSIQKSRRSKNPCYILFFYWSFYVNSWDKVAGSHDKHSVLIRDRFTFFKGKGLRLLYKLVDFYVAEKLISLTHFFSKCKDIAIFPLFGIISVIFSAWFLADDFLYYS